MSAIERQIDDLYTLPLAEFTSARNAFAKTLQGDDRARVQRLEKPAVVPWLVNQLYWRGRPDYDRLLAAGRTLRAAQIAALNGGGADLRAATAAHRSAVAAAAAAIAGLGIPTDVRIPTESLSRMLEALSLAHQLPAAPGRFVALLQPAGFEALAGITPNARPQPPRAERRPATTPAPAREAAASTLVERKRAEARAAARTAADEAVRQARRRLEEATAAASRAQAQVDAARSQLAQAERTQAEARAAADRAALDVERAEAARRAI